MTVGKTADKMSGKTAGKTVRPTTAAALAVALLAATPAMAKHPGANLNEVTAAKEPAFEAVDNRPIPGLDLSDASGTAFGAESFSGKIVAVSFVPKGCGAPCTDQQDRLAKALDSLNATPMRGMVQFVTISDAPVDQAAPFDNWTAARPAQGDGSASLATAFAAESDRQGETPMIHLLDRKGRQVGIFHGTDFQPINLVLYINGLTNVHPHPDPGLFERWFGWLR